jgi:hypothetical protein
MGKVTVNQPVPCCVGVGQRTAGDFPPVAFCLLSQALQEEEKNVSQPQAPYDRDDNSDEGSSSNRGKLFVDATRTPAEIAMISQA